MPVPPVPAANQRSLLSLHMQCICCLSIPRSSAAVAINPHPPSPPNSVSLVFPPSPDLVLLLHSEGKTKSASHTQLPYSGLFMWQHPCSEISRSEVPGCQQHTGDDREMDSDLQTLPKSHNKYSSSNTKSRCMLYLPT